MRKGKEPGEEAQEGRVQEDEETGKRTEMIRFLAQVDMYNGSGDRGGKTNLARH